METAIHSTPKDVRGALRFLLLPMDFRELWIGERPIGEYLAARDDAQRERFHKEMRIADVEFRARLGERLGSAVVPFHAPGVFTLRATLERWEPGEMFQSDAEAHLVLAVFDDHAREIERTRLMARQTANVHFPTPADRIRACAQKLADRAASFLDVTDDA